MQQIKLKITKMKKFIVKYKDTNKTFGEFTSKEEASDKVMEYINGHYISPFDFVLEEVECKDVNEVITDFDSARKVLGIKPLEGIIVSKRLEGVERLVREINPKHLEALIALNQLFTIAETWNKEDGFVPDVSNLEQEKWFPRFKYNEDAEKFIFSYTNYIPTIAHAKLGSRLCFKTYERAEQFGKQFADLYNKVFLP